MQRLRRPVMPVGPSGDAKGRRSRREAGLEPVKLHNTFAEGETHKCVGQCAIPASRCTELLHRQRQSAAPAPPPDIQTKPDDRYLFDTQAS
jgi:hypothetical protein